MAKMTDNVRAWWNSFTESIGNPGQLAQLSVADLEKSIRKAKEAAATVVGQPAILSQRLKELETTDGDLTSKITALIQTGEAGQEAARKYVQRQVTVRQQIETVKQTYADAKTASDEWQAKISFLENQLYERRMEANKLQSQYHTAKAEQNLGRQMQNADSLLGSDNFSSVKARIEKEQAKAAGYSAMSGITDKVNDERIIADAKTDNLMKEYLSKLN